MNAKRWMALFLALTLAITMLAEKPQISGDDQIVVLRAAMEILKMLPDGVDGSGRHRSSHVVCVLDAEILNFADGCALDERSAAAV